ncbi:MAG TPA: hypothetical protein DEA61_04140 [Caldanaerobacter subterraneus]|uniref:4Fe-4S ferredoxin-type domain-containing protein n=1 Tax=Caldanaerobacter subterraneus TaxID=911092 RepID=A0A357VL93_9THEO|nr:4Fe-4S binding protein [Caldanaerobacter sp.]HBT49032.1 hypothetical protein [Caldanaerobacter subterraneus]
MVKNKKLVIIEEWCKGCGICVVFCPVEVFVFEFNCLYKIRQKWRNSFENI